MKQVVINIGATGQSGNITFRKSPYGAGDGIGSLSVTEPVTNNYLITGFTTFQLAKLFISGVEQTWWGEQYVGDEETYFVALTGNQTIAGNKSFSGSTALKGVSLDGNMAVTTAHAITGSGTAYCEFANFFALDQTYTPASNACPPLYYVDRHFRPAGSNELIVDADVTAVTGKVYNTIAAAVAYAQASGSPGSTNQWHIHVYENKAGYYTENFTWYDWIHLIGHGNVIVKNTSTYSAFIRSGFTTKVKCENIHFENTDTNILFKAMIVRNCSCLMIEDGLACNLQFENSQLENSNFSFNSSGTITSSGTNRIIGCSSSHNVTWNTSTDNLYPAGWNVLGGDFYVNG